MILPCLGCRRTVALRNHIIHEYAEVNTEIVWASVLNEVSRLLEKSEVVLEESDHGG